MKAWKISALIFLSMFLNNTSILAQPSSTAASNSVSAKAANRALAKSVRRSLGRVKGLDPTRIYVKAAGGVVTLSGTLRTQAQIDLAVTTASGVNGVDSVNNRITIFNEGGD